MSAISWVWLRMDVMNKLSNQISQWEKWKWYRMNLNLLSLPQKYVKNVWNSNSKCGRTQNVH
jgi:hypothetical protein